MSLDDPYAVLGVATSASDEEIRQAYSCQIRQHPFETDPEGFERIRAAYESLIDEDRDISADAKAKLTDTVAGSCDEAEFHEERQQSESAVPPPSPSVIQHIVAALRDPEPCVRRAALESLASMGPEAEAATDEIGELISDPDPGVREAAMSSLSAILAHRGTSESQDEPVSQWPQFDPNVSIEYVTEQAGVTSEVARNALDRCGWDSTRAVHMCTREAELSPHRWYDLAMVLSLPLCRLLILIAFWGTCRAAKHLGQYPKCTVTRVALWVGAICCILWLGGLCLHTLLMLEDG